MRLIRFVMTVKYPHEKPDDISENRWAGMKKWLDSRMRDDDLNDAIACSGSR